MTLIGILVLQELSAVLLTYVTSTGHISVELL